MPLTLDCEVLRDLYGTEEVRAVFESRALVQAWLDVERVLAEAEAEVGVVPPTAAERIAAECDASRYDLGELREGIAASKHPLVPLIRALVERCGDAGGWVHWGATTQDIVDTALVLQARRAMGPIGRDLDRAWHAACDLAVEYAETPMAGRTHAQHAVPITFGLKAATWADELGRARDRLSQTADAALVAQLSGAAGTFATLGDAAGPVQEAFARRLGLGARASTGTRPAIACATWPTRSPGSVVRPSASRPRSFGSSPRRSRRSPSRQAMRMWAPRRCHRSAIR